jgi:hypothetical protein
MMRRVGGWAAGRAAPWILPAQRSAAARGTVGVPSVASASRPSAPLGMGVMRSYCDEEELSPFAEKVIKAETLPDGRFKFYFDVRPFIIYLFIYLCIYVYIFIYIYLFIYL